MTRHTRIPAVLALLALLSGCAVTTFTLNNPARLAAPGSGHPAQATIYVMRDNSRVSALWAANVWTDNVSRGSLWQKSYVNYAVAPGPHDITIKRSFMSGVPSLAVKGNFEADKTYYFMIGTSFDSRGTEMRFGGELSQIPRESALPLLKYYVDANDHEAMAAEAAAAP